MGTVGKETLSESDLAEKTTMRRISCMASSYYHGGAPGVSKTDLDYAALSPANMAARKLAPPADSEALRFGQAFHTAMELFKNPETFKKMFTVMPKFSGEGMKKKKEEWLGSVGAAQILDTDDAEQIAGMVSGVMAHPQARLIAEADGTCEETFFWTDEVTDVRCKCRPDKLIEGGLFAGMVVDWKSIGQFSQYEIEKAMAEHNYHVSAAFTLDGVSRVIGKAVGPYVYAFVEKKPPHRVLLVPAQQMDVEIGRAHYRRVLAKIAESQQTGVWPGFVDVGLPVWFRTRELEKIAAENPSA